MREILYIQAGTLANYTGSHFWNTQECYFTYDESEEPLTSHDISFRETLIKREPTLCPRLLIFDRKSNFGTLSKSNALPGNEGHEDTTGQLVWNGELTELREELVTRSNYQNQMDHELDEVDPPCAHEDPHEVSADSEIRYWSDFNRVYFSPRSVQKLPDIANYENAERDWNRGQEEFARFDQETALMEDSFRLFVEECDNLQGIQVINDTATFGPFVHSFLASVHDDLSKLTCLIFPILSDAIPGAANFVDTAGLNKVVVDALCLRGLHESSSMTIPIQSPSIWSTQSLHLEGIFDKMSAYQSSAILSAHIETTTLPLRLKKGNDDITGFSSQLNWRGITRFGHLSGIVPVTSATTFDGDISQFSESQSRSTTAAYNFSRRDVSRGLPHPVLLAYDTWRNGLLIREPFLSSVHLPPFPLPTSSPSIFTSTLTYPRVATKTSTAVHSPLPSVAMLSSITVTSKSAELFASYAGFVSDCARRRSHTIPGLDSDELKELSNDLWTIRDNFGEGSEGVDDPEMYGEDEE